MRDGRPTERLQRLYQRLGYLGSEGMTRLADVVSGRRVGHAVREAFASLGIDGVFGLAEDVEGSARFKPIVYVAEAASENEIVELRRSVWTQGAVPLLVILAPGRCLLLNGFASPDTAELTAFDDGEPTWPKAALNLAANRIRSALTWRDFDIDLQSTVDVHLVKAITALNRLAVGSAVTLKGRPDVVNALIGRHLYLYVLIDRGIVSVEWLTRSTDGGPGVRAFIEAAAGANDGEYEQSWTASDVFEVFDVLDGTLNGSVFEIVDHDRALVSDYVCHLIHRVVRRNSVVEAGGEQLGFFDVRYGVIRTETISAIYERFVTTDGITDKSENGVFYTPPYLVDHVLDRIEEVDSLTRASRVFDPAAGSGSFLVGAYRRIMERHEPKGGWSIRHAEQARTLLTECIFGCEHHPQAVAVCRFSLYLTLLDYVGHAPLQELAAKLAPLRFFPSLIDNVKRGDTFELSQTMGDFSHVIGNPPWSQITGRRRRSNVGGRVPVDSKFMADFAATLTRPTEPLNHSRMSDLFFWLSVKRLGKPNAAIALLLPAHSLIGRHATAFAHAVAKATTPAFVGNLSHLRRKLFDGADAPACVVVTVNRTPTSADRAVVYRPLLSGLPLGRHRAIWALFPSQSEMDICRVADLQNGISGWFEEVMLGTLDRRSKRALTTWSKSRCRTLGDFLERSGLLMQRGGYPKQSGADKLLPQTEEDEKKPSVIDLSWDEIATLTPKFRGRHAGHVILVPRSMAKTSYRPKPVYFTSSFNVIVDAVRQASLEIGVPSQDTLPSRLEQCRGGLMAYLDSGVLRYFAALFGATFLMEGARFEHREILAVPCPFEDINDPALLKLANDPNVDDAVLDAMKAGREFRGAFRDFNSFRAGFGNSKIPAQAFKAPDSETRSHYLARLSAEIQASEMRGAVPEIATEEGVADFDTVQVGFSDASMRRQTEDVMADRFVGTALVGKLPGSTTAFVIKPKARHAWTIEQAVADAQALRREFSPQRNKV